MYANKDGFLLIEAILLLEIVVILISLMFFTMQSYRDVQSEDAYQFQQEDTLIRKAYEI